MSAEMRAFIAGMLVHQPNHWPWLPIRSMPIGGCRRGTGHRVRRPGVSAPIVWYAQFPERRKPVAWNTGYLQRTPTYLAIGLCPGSGPGWDRNGVWSHPIRLLTILWFRLRRLWRRCRETLRCCAPV